MPKRKTAVDTAIEPPVSQKKRRTRASHDDAFDPDVIELQNPLLKRRTSRRHGRPIIETSSDEPSTTDATDNAFSEEATNSSHASKSSRTPKRPPPRLNPEDYPCDISSDTAVSERDQRIIQWRDLYKLELAEIVQLCINVGYTNSRGEASFSTQGINKRYGDHAGEYYTDMGIPRPDSHQRMRQKREREQLAPIEVQKAFRDARSGRVLEFYFWDENGEVTIDNNPPLINVNIAIAKSNKLRKILRDDPRATSIMVKPHVSKDTVQRLIQCLSDDQCIAPPTHDLWTRSKDSVVVLSQPAYITLEEIECLYILASDLGCDDICDMLIDHIAEKAKDSTLEYGMKSETRLLFLDHLADRDDFVFLNFWLDLLAREKGGLRAVQQTVRKGVPSSDLGGKLKLAVQQKMDAGVKSSIGKKGSDFCKFYHHHFPGKLCYKVRIGQVQQCEQAEAAT